MKKKDIEKFMVELVAVGATFVGFIAGFVFLVVP